MCPNIVNPDLIHIHLRVTALIEPVTKQNKKKQSFTIHKEETN